MNTLLYFKWYKNCFGVQNPKMFFKCNLSVKAIGIEKNLWIVDRKMDRKKMDIAIE